MLYVKNGFFVLLLVLLQGCLHNNFKRAIWTDSSMPSSFAPNTRVSINGVQRIGIADSVDLDKRSANGSYDSIKYNLKTRTLGVAKVVDDQIEKHLLGFDNVGPLSKKCFADSIYQNIVEDQPPVPRIDSECQQKAKEQDIRYIFFVPGVYGYHQSIDFYRGLQHSQFYRPATGTQLLVWDVQAKKYVQSVFLSGYFGSDTLKQQELSQEYAYALVEPLPVTNANDALVDNQRTADHRALEFLVHFEMLMPVGGDINRDLKELKPVLIGPHFSIRYIHSRWGLEAMFGNSIAKSEYYPEDQLGLESRYQFNAMYYFFQAKAGRFGFYGGASYATIKTYDVYAEFLKEVGLPEEAPAFGFQGGLVMDALLDKPNLILHSKIGWQNLSGDFKRTNLDIQGFQTSLALGYRFKLLQ